MLEPLALTSAELSLLESCIPFATAQELDRIEELLTGESSTLNPLRFIENLLIPTREGPKRFGDVMQPYQREWLNRLVPDLAAVAGGYAPPAGKHWWEATKGCSKTTMVACVVIWLSIYASDPLLMQAGAVDRDNAAELVKSAKAVLHVNEGLRGLVEVQNWAIVGTKTGTTCEIVAADKKGSHGGKPALTFLDECGHVPDERWEFVSNMLDNAAKVAGIVICATNAGWTETEAYKLREIARSSPRWQFCQWAKPSPLMDLAEVEEAARRNPPGRQARLYWGVWGPKDEGDSIPPHMIDAACVLAGPVRQKISGIFPYVAGLDLGLKRDHSAFSAIGVDVPRARLKLMECVSWAPSGPQHQVDMDAIENYVVDAHRRFEFSTICYDPWQAEHMAQRLVKRGVPMVPIHSTPQNLNRMATQLLQVFTDQQVELYPDEQLMRDLRQLTIIERMGGFKIEAPRNEHGHCDRATSLFLAIPAAVQWQIELATGRV